MPELVTVYHGTSHAFRVDLEDKGIPARPGLSKGVRISLTRELALVHAAAWCAYIMLMQQLPPKALLVRATIDKRRVREGAETNPLAGIGIGPYSVPVVGPALVVPGGLRAAEISLEEIRMDFLYSPEPARRALSAWERMTDRKITTAPSRRRG